MIRAWANVSMICSTIVDNSSGTVANNSDSTAAITRDNLTCKITYVAQGNFEEKKN
jgi:hypothetical protein